MFCNAVIFRFRTLFQNFNVYSQTKQLARPTWKGRDGARALRARVAMLKGNPSEYPRDQGYSPVENAVEIAA